MANLIICLKDTTAPMISHSTVENPSIRDIKRSVDRKVGKGQWLKVYTSDGYVMTPSYKIQRVSKEAQE